MTNNTKNLLTSNKETTKGVNGTIVTVYLKSEKVWLTMRVIDGYVEEEKLNHYKNDARALHFLWSVTP